MKIVMKVTFEIKANLRDHIFGIKAEVKLVQNVENENLHIKSNLKKFEAETDI